MDMILVANGVEYRLDVEPRRLLCDVLREDCGLTGTHVGCEQGACGSCTVLLDGLPVRSCLLFAVQARGHEVRTVEGLAGADGPHPVQRAFVRHHALQCGFCTPGFLMLLAGALEEDPAVDDARLREIVSSNLCRCTGYRSILDAARAAADDLAELRRGAPPSTGG
jgi:carbon-monoxide dehydrogenase small subunit